MKEHLIQYRFKRIHYILIVAIVIVILPFAKLMYANTSTNADASSTLAGKTLIMGTSPDYPPYEYVDAANGGEIIGLDIDIARSIGDKLGFAIEIRSIDFNGLVAALQTERVDFVMSGMSVTEERKQSVQFSNEYYMARNTIVSRNTEPYESIEQLYGQTVGSQLGSIQQLYAETIPGVQQKYLNKIPDLIQELNSSRIQAAIVEDAVALEMVAANSNLVINYIPASNEDNGYAIAFPLQSELVASFNTALAEMKLSGELQQIIDKWFADAGNTSAGTGDKGLIDFSVLNGYVPYILKGTYVTLLFTLVSALLGLILGVILSLCKISSVRPLQWFATAYTSVFRGTPLLVQLTLIYYAIPQLFNYDIPALLAAGLAFGLNSAAYLSETIRAGILAVDKGQREASIALGIPYRTMMQRIIFPQALRNILPSLVNEVIALLKESSLVSVIGVSELMRRADVVRAGTFRAFEVLLLIAAIYYVLVLILTSFARILERRLRRSD